MVADDISVEIVKVNACTAAASKRTTTASRMWGLVVLEIRGAIVLFNGSPG